MDTVTVQVVGSPVACVEGVQETWRDVVSWAASQLKARYGMAVRVEYFDLIR